MPSSSIFFADSSSLRNLRLYFPDLESSRLNVRGSNSAVASAARTFSEDPRRRRGRRARGGR